MDHAVVWFEIAVENMDRAMNFYGTILDHTFEVTQIEDALMAFWPTDGSVVSGALIKYKGNTPGTTGTLVYLNGGEDLNTVLSKVEEAGGTVEIPKTQISEEIGYMGIFHDTEGNRVALHSRK